MSSTLENKIMDMQERLMAEQGSSDGDRELNNIIPGTTIQSSSSLPMSSPIVRRPIQREYLIYALQFS